MERFDLRFSRLNRAALSLLGLGPGSSGIEVSKTEVVVRMGWGFRAYLPREAVRSASIETRLPFLGWGVHGWRGRWLVNGSSTGLVKLEIAPAQKARVSGVRVRLVELWLSVEHPEALVSALELRRRP